MFNVGYCIIILLLLIKSYLKKVCHYQLFFVVILTGADPASANVHIANLFNQRDESKSFDNINQWEFFKVGKVVENAHAVEGSIFEYMQQHAGNSSNLSKSYLSIL